MQLQERFLTFRHPKRGTTASVAQTCTWCEVPYPSKNLFIMSDGCFEIEIEIFHHQVCQVCAKQIETN